ncbi:MAG: phytanoyl-CoA dioxygenase family protein [Anaerolineales bacterium]
MSMESTGLGSLTAAQVEFYETEGYLTIPHLLNEADLRPAREAMEQKVSMIAEGLLADGLITDKLEALPFRTRLAALFADLTDADFLKYGRSWRDRLPGYYDLMMNPLILDAVESLIGGELFANPVYNARPKVPRVAAGAVPWHQDKSYWPGANANPVITVWIPLVDSNLENGCLHIMPRTHTRRLLPFHNEQVTGTGYLETDEAHLAPGARVLAVPLEAGGALLFNDRCLHMSTANNSDHVRWSVDLRYQPTDQDPMTRHGIGFLARSRLHPERVATREDWMEERTEHG